MGSSSFLKEAISNLKTVGSVRPSSAALSRAMASPVNVRVQQTIIELGAGEGTITHHILKRMHPASRLFVFEINENFLSQLKEINDSKMTVVNDSAENLQRQLQRLGINEVDVIVSSLPLVIFEKESAERIIHACYDSLKRGGVFVQFHYSYFNKKMYERVFDWIRVKFILGNLPPAFVFRCKKLK
ncbi:MAG TPA: methyltransferase domain-containing protein [Chitinophagales bacterium]|nr:methyltransferase domain-containing protein [Chitinophagales bacterium]